MEDAYQIEPVFAGGAFGFQEIFGTEFVTLVLHALEGVFEREGLGDQFLFPLDVPEHDAAAFVWIGLFGVENHGLPGVFVDRDHDISLRGWIMMAVMRRSVSTYDSFAKTAKAFCAHIESAGSHELAPFARECFGLISRLLAEIVKLPAGRGKLDTHRASRERYEEIVARLKEQFGMHDYYRMLFYAYEPDEAPLYGSLSDDMADIWADLMGGLEALRSGHSGDAIEQWRFSFACHWGSNHAVNVLKPLIALLLKEGWYE